MGKGTDTHVETLEEHKDGTPESNVGNCDLICANSSQMDSDRHSQQQLQMSHILHHILHVISILVKMASNLSVRKMPYSWIQLKFIT